MKLQTRFLSARLNGERKMLFHLYSIWLFTLSDLKTIVVPKTIFGILNAIAILADPKVFDEHPTKVITILARAPLVSFWVWINLLPFAIDNQRQPAAILEDKHNKPWRTMPSGRMTGRQARALMLCLYPTAVLFSLKIGGIRQCLALIALGYAYNDLSLADRGWMCRNFINAMGFCCFASGALEVALRTPLTWDHHHTVLKWLGVIAAVVFSTVQSQDMADQVGDRLRGRRSMPLSLGDGPTRWITAVLMVGWVIISTMYWTPGRGAQMGIAVLGLIVARRTLVYRCCRSDKVTFRVWNAWMAGLYALPLLSAFSG